MVTGVGTGDGDSGNVEGDGAAGVKGSGDADGDRMAADVGKSVGDAAPRVAWEHRRQQGVV